MLVNEIGRNGRVYRLTVICECLEGHKGFIFYCFFFNACQVQNIICKLLTTHLGRISQVFKGSLF